MKSTLARLQAVVSPSVSRLEEYENLFCAQPFWVRRQAGVGIMAVALSAAALYDVEALRGTVDEMKTRQNELVHQLVSVSNASALNSQNIRRLRGALVMLCLLYTSPSPRDS